MPELSGVQQVNLTSAEVEPTNRAVMSAFIPTGSSSPSCLVTLAEDSISAESGTTVFCGTRNYNGADGIFLHIFLPILAPATPGVLVTVTVYQDAAHGYGTPVYFSGT